MLNVVDNPVGIDIPIRKLQEFLHSSLLKKWSNISSAEYQSHPRCYRNKDDRGYNAEVFISDNSLGKKDYEDVYWDDKLAAISFFGIDVKMIHDKVETTNVHLVFFVNLFKLKPQNINRPDEEVRLDVIELVKSSNYGFEYKSLDLSIENVLREYPGNYRDRNLQVVDIHPVHCFRLNFSLNYNIKNCY